MKETFEGTSILIYLKDHSLALTPHVDVGHLALIPMLKGHSAISIEKDAKTGKLKITLSKSE